MASRVRGAERRRRLERLAKPHEPEEPPFYVRAEDRDPAHPTPGWYWIPRGVDGPIYLGYSSIDAEIALRLAGR